MYRLRYFILLFIFSLPTGLSAQRFDRGITQITFIPKGQWITGCNISYSQHTNKNYKFLVIEGWNGEGYNFSVSPFLLYCFKDNLAGGGKFEYTRSLLKIDNLDISIDDDLSFSLSDIYTLKHGYYATGLFRAYLNLGESKRFGLFNEVQLKFGGTQSKLVSGSGKSLTGTYESSFDFGLGMAPGMIAFVNDYAAVEVTVGVLGFNVKSINQTTDQVIVGSRKASSANFKINLLALSLGLSFYL